MTIPSIPRGPERAWTTCVSGAAISGLFRSDYAPENVQALPPGMTPAEFDALPLTPGCPGPFPGDLDNGCVNDCFPRYVPWVEQGRTPDFAGGDPVLEWTRGKGWEERPGCEIPEPPPPQFCTLTIQATVFGSGNPVTDCDAVLYIDFSVVPFWSGPLGPTGSVTMDLPAGTVNAFVEGDSPTYGIQDGGWQNVPIDGPYTYQLVFFPV